MAQFACHYLETDTEKLNFSLGYDIHLVQAVRQILAPSLSLSCHQLLRSNKSPMAADMIQVDSPHIQQLSEQLLIL